VVELFNMDCRDFVKQYDFQNKPYCIVTDPPFNIGYKYNSYKDNMKQNEYIEFLKYVVTYNGFPFVIIHYPESLHQLSISIGKAPDKVCSWVYNSNNQKQHRDIAYWGGDKA